jgi:ribonuclease J
MHARQDDLKYFLSVLKPKYYLPVRGKFTRLIANAKLAVEMGIGLNHSNVFVLDNGTELIFDESPRPRLIPNEVNKIDISPLLVDGTGISKYGDSVIEERKKLGVDGLVIVAVTISASEKKIIAGPDCQMRGFVFAKEAEPILKMVSTIFVEEIKMVLAQGSLNFEKAKENTMERSKRFIFRENGRRPLILPEIIIVE